MKLITIISALLILYNCSMSKELTKEQGEKVYEHKVELKEGDIKQKLLLFVNEKFMSGKSVIQTDTEGLFTGNGIVNLPDLPFGSGTIKMEITFMVKYSENNYKVKWIAKDLMTGAGSISPNMWGYYSESIEKSIAENDKNLFDYLSDKTNEF